MTRRNSHDGLDLLIKNPRPFKQKNIGFSIFKSLFILFITGSFFFLLLGVLIFFHFSKDLPQLIRISDYRPLTVTRLVSAEGIEVGEFFKERRYLVPYESIPEITVRAFVAAEDDHFFEHSGVHFLSIFRASIANFKAGHIVQGGSTITQQVAKSLLLTPERSFDRKIKEMILAWKIEKNLSKQQILYLYLNQIYLGHGAYGVAAASKVFFKKEVGQLNLAESALLAGMPQAPGKYNPQINPKRAKERQLYVLRRMVENNYITQSQMNEAASQILKIYYDENLNQKYAPYYVEFIRKYLMDKYGEKAVYEEGLTALLAVQVDSAKAAEKSVQEGLRAIDQRAGFRGPLKHLEKREQIEFFLKQYQLELVKKKFGYQLFLPEGKCDILSVMHQQGNTSYLELLEEGVLYQAVVVGIEESKHIAIVRIGEVRAELALEKMKWARPVKDERLPDQNRTQPTFVSSVLKKGDIIWVSLLQSPFSSFSRARVALEQEPQVQGALVSLEAKTGHVIAMVGGYSFEESEFNRAIQANRQQGSAFKPIIYASALEKGFTPASMIVDSPVVFKDTEGVASWKPTNFEEKFYGDTTFRQAFVKSRNIPTIKVVQSVQVPYLIQYAKRLGMSGPFNLDLSIALGSSTINLLELTRVYALFPRLGRKVKPVFLIKLMDRDGKVLEQSQDQLPYSMKKKKDSTESKSDTIAALSSSSPTQETTEKERQKVFFPNYPLPEDPEQVLDPRVAYVMTHLMKDVVNYGTGNAAKNLGRLSAGKTGTTNDFMDAWFVGFTPSLITGVWSGYDNQKSIGPFETGAKAALPIWLSYMKEAVKKYPESDFTVPEGVVFSKIDPLSGKIITDDAINGTQEAFIEGTQPIQKIDSKETKSQSDFLKEDKE